MIISINQPAYLPWLGYFNRIVKSDLHVVLDHVQFEKNSFTNRNKILSNKNPLWLTLPVLTKGFSDNLQIQNLLLDNKINWQKKHFLSIEQAYSKAKYWLEFKSEVKEIYIKQEDFLINVLNKSLDFFVEYLNIKTPVVYTSNYSFKEKKSDLVLEICQKFNASKYISGSLGRNYLELDKFQENGIEVVFDDYIHPVYAQKSENFLPYLSTLDLIANCGKDSLRILTNV